jgi:single-stranded-DNA-specific exonuclease
MERWFVKNIKADFQLIGKQFGISEILARLIVNRRIQNNEEMERYINPLMKYMHNPLEMKDLEKASSILIEKIREGKSIRIIGDYDVDGVMATYILFTALKKCKANVDYEIPDRIKDGYGINTQIIQAAYQDKVDTIITCDNGISAIKQIEYAKELGMTVIITDHHDIPYTEEDGGDLYQVPNSDAVVNPKQQDCNYPFKNICGALVAYKLVEVLYDKSFIHKDEISSLIEFAAIATVCDVMDLVDENRVVVKNGLKALQYTKHIGLQALISEIGLADKKIGVYHIGFMIGPCINASGRLESAKIGLELLLTREEGQAKILAKRLKELNDERKDMTFQGLERAVNIIEESSLKEDKVLVVYMPDCHESLAGIIAGKIREKYSKPTVVLTRGVEGVKGSGRSIEGYHMFKELRRCQDILGKFGGHPMAAGLSLREDKIEELRERLNKQTTLTKEELTPKITFDMVLPFSDISITLLKEISLLEPFGKGNAKPLFAKKNVGIEKATILGVNKNVLRLLLKNQNGKRPFTGIIFNDVEGFEEIITKKYGIQGLKDLYLGQGQGVFIDIIFYPEINEFNGYENIQIIIQNYH